ncbi:MAG: hypothetical protein IKW66_00405, partial [Clostridia bacterium]|nr:hypothetical protein [Clostridia bacterium]
EERQCQGDSKRKRLGAFLVTSWGAPRSNIKKAGTDQRAVKPRSMIVHRNGRLKTTYLPPSYAIMSYANVAHDIMSRQNGSKNAIKIGKNFRCY